MDIPATLMTRKDYNKYMYEKRKIDKNIQLVGHTSGEQHWKFNPDRSSTSAKYYDENRQKLLENHQQRVLCEFCNQFVCKYYLKKHIRTQHEKFC